MKKTILFLFAALMLLASCEDAHVHEWTSTIEKEPGCETEGLLIRTCTCGAREEEKLKPVGHKEGVTKTVKAPSCTEPGTTETVCPVCNKTFSTVTTNAKGHTPGETKITSEPTCTETGVEETYCKECGESIEKKTVDAKGHKLLSGKIVLKAATCTEKGLESGVCGICEEKIDSVETPALGHDWGETQIVLESTCTTEGKAQQICQRDHEHVRNGIIEKKAHSFTGLSTTISEADCINQGKVTTKCINCDTVTTSYTPALGHSFTVDKGYKLDNDNNPITPTTFTPGIKIFQCERCDETEEEEVWDESTRHVHLDPNVPGGWFQDSSNIYGNNVEATCTTKGKIGIYCSCYQDADGNFYLSDDGTRTRYLIGYKETEIDSTKHGTIVKETTAVSSYFYGSVTEEKCSDCKAVLSTTYNEEGKVSAVGRWTGDVTTQIDAGTVLNADISCDISLYSNGVSVFKNTMILENNETQEKIGGDYVDTFLMMSGESLSSYSNLTRATDGRWISSDWGVAVHNSSSKKIKFLNFEDSSFNNFAITISNEDVGSKKMKSNMFGDSEDSLLVLSCQNVPVEKGILSINNINSFTAQSFGKDNNINTVTIPSGSTSVILEWITLQGEGPAVYNWTVDNVAQDNVGKTITITSSCIVSCTANDETHIVKIIFQ